MLWTIAAIFFVLIAGIAIFLIWSNSSSRQSSSLNLSDFINLLSAFLTFVGLAVAFESLQVANQAYQKSVQDGLEQQKHLDASRVQLQAVVEAAIKQQDILNRNLETSKAQQEILNKNLQTSKIQQELQGKNLETSKAQLVLLQEQSKREVESAVKQQDILHRNLETSKAQQELLNKTLHASMTQQEIQGKNLETSKAQLNLLEEQRKREQEKEARKPIAEMGISTKDGMISIMEPEKLPVFQFDVDKDKKWSRMAFVVWNKGNIEIFRPTIRIFASPNTISVDHVDFRMSQRYEHHILEFSGADVKDIDPLEVSKRPYSYTVEITVPDSVETFDLTVSVQGKNLPRIERKINLKVIRPPA